jgi:hypothetical protein
MIFVLDKINVNLYSYHLKLCSKMMHFGLKTCNIKFY